jgi:hypothetical protein
LFNYKEAPSLPPHASSLHRSHSFCLSCFASTLSLAPPFPRPGFQARHTLPPVSRRRDASLCHLPSFAASPRTLPFARRPSAGADSFASSTRPASSVAPPPTADVADIALRSPARPCLEDGPPKSHPRPIASPVPSPPPTRYLSAIYGLLRQRTTAEWKRRWAQGSKGGHVRQLNAEPSRAIRMLHTGREKAHSLNLFHSINH